MKTWQEENNGYIFHCSLEVIKKNVQWLEVTCYELPSPHNKAQGKIGNSPKSVIVSFLISEILTKNNIKIK